VASGRNNLPASLKTKSKITLAELAAHSTEGLLVNFWATWCPPCLEELPALDYLNRQLERAPKGKMPLLVTISVDEAVEDVSGLFETLDFSPTLLVLHDPNGNFSAELGTTRFPETYWISPSGAIQYKWIGPQNWLSEEVLVTLLTQAGI
jgi:cytochrome c biogenesis protein CcmG, thiol:disulfide interchange protein DsbE